MPGCLKVWKIGPVEIHPHLSWSECLSPEQLREKAYEVQTNLNDFRGNVIVWDQSTYTSETNGSWNVTLSVITENTSLQKEIEYIYMIRRDKKFNKTFGCPYYNSEYAHHTHTLPHPHRPLLEYYNSDLFKRFERALIEVIGEAEHIDHFETSIN